MPRYAGPSGRAESLIPGFRTSGRNTTLGYDVTLEFDSSELSRNIVKLQQTMLEDDTQVYIRFLMQMVLEEAQRLVPIGGNEDHSPNDDHSMDLYNAISYQIGTQRTAAGNIYTGVIYVKDIPYAMIQHETPPPNSGRESLVSRVSSKGTPSGYAELQRLQRINKGGFKGYYEHEPGKSWKYLEIPMHTVGGDAIVTAMSMTMKSIFRTALTKFSIKYRGR